MWRQNRKILAYRNPGMLQCFKGGDSLVWVHSQHLVDEVFGLWCDCVPLGLWILLEKGANVTTLLKNQKSTYVIRPGLDLCVQFVLILVPEGRIADEEDVENDAARPDVHWLAVRLLLQHLRREVAGSAGEAEPRLLVALQLDRQTKVGQFDGSTFHFTS